MSCYTLSRPTKPTWLSLPLLLLPFLDLLTKTHLPSLPPSVPPFSLWPQVSRTLSWPSQRSEPWKPLKRIGVGSGRRNGRRTAGGMSREKGGREGGREGGRDGGRGGREGCYFLLKNEIIWSDLNGKCQILACFLCLPFDFIPCFFCYVWV